MSTENKDIVKRFVLEAEEEGKIELIDQFLAEDFVDHTPLPGFSPTREGVKSLFAALQSGISDLKIRIDDQVAEGDVVVTRKTFQGVHDGPLLGAPASRNKLNFEVVDFLTVKNGKITEHRVILDQLTLLKQLGAIQ